MLSANGPGSLAGTVHPTRATAATEETAGAAATAGGGNGGSGGAITVGVLTGTLASTVANKSFRLKNQGGRKASGGPGGSGGAGGRGGRSGNGETCTSAKDGHGGAQGQPGGTGASGFSDGSDALVTFFEFTEAAWDDLMTRPWITQVSPPEAFPGARSSSAAVASGRGCRRGGRNQSRVDAQCRRVALRNGADDDRRWWQQVFVRRADGTESNRVNIGIKPELGPSAIRSLRAQR